MNQSNNEASRLFPIFFPHALKKQQEALQNSTRFVHYTSAETAMSIITKQEVWMRNVKCMNDYMEVEYGLNHLFEAFKSPAGEKLKKALNTLFPDIIGEIGALFDEWLFDLRTNTYITCISEHLSEEDGIGRLSMWRAYGRDSGIALVIKNVSILSDSNILKVYSNPVGYLTGDEIITMLDTIAENILREYDYIKFQSREQIKQTVFNLIMFAILCIKHPGFREEKEWRIVYCPNLMQSSHVKKEIRAVNGIPQQIYKIPLMSVPDQNLYASIPDILDHIIVGPTEYSLEIYKALVELLSEAGVSEPEKKVIGSNIPLRR